MSGCCALLPAVCSGMCGGDAGQVLLSLQAEQSALRFIHGPDRSIKQCQGSLGEAASGGIYQVLSSFHHPVLVSDRGSLPGPVIMLILQQGQGVLQQADVWVGVVDQGHHLAQQRRLAAVMAGFGEHRAIRRSMYLGSSG